MQEIEINELLLFAVQFVSFFILSFMGAIIKEIYNTNSASDHDFSAYKVFTGTILATILSIVVQDYCLEEYGWKLMVAVSFLLGLCSSELFEKITSLNGIKRIIELFIGRKLPDIEEVDEDEKEQEYKHIKPVPKVHINIYHNDEKNK